MKAITRTRYGAPDVLDLSDIGVPVPRNDELLIKVQAASVNIGDWYYLIGKPFVVRLSPGGLFRPRLAVLGGDFAGIVEEVGPDIHDFSIGDEVYGDVSGSGMGAFAEYVTAPPSVVAKKPANLSFAEAAAVPTAAVTALQGLRDAGELVEGQNVAINGASGGVGTFAVQIARAFGAKVTGICSKEKIDLVRSLGADDVVDYMDEDFTRREECYDLVVGVNGHRSLSDYRRSLCTNGTYVCIGGAMRQIFSSLIFGPALSKRNGRQIRNMGSVRMNSDDLKRIGELIEAGKVFPVIDTIYPLSETREALRYLGSGHVEGKVVITLMEAKA